MRDVPVSAATILYGLYFHPTVGHKADFSAIHHTNPSTLPGGLSG
ncbi:MAG TPA: hypothetical protein VK979_02115 [Guyparkeria sp.]|nr:hypothetical protein [Guyparkeria sp.]HZJ81133.1 hypothetical protein [Guyparkeria sp.]